MVQVSGLLILGFGGHARSVADVALASGFKTLCFIDSNARPNECLGEFPVKTDWHGALPEGWVVMPGAGDNNKRQDQCDWIIERGWPLATLISPAATIGFGATVGLGTLVAHHAHIGPMASVGRGCIVNTGAIIEHECVVDDFTHVSIKAAVAGRSRIGRLCFIGAGSTVIDGIRLSDGVTLGAGACAHRDLEEPGVYVGVPAKKVIGKIQN
ncbi:acetyltransferase [Pseudomonas sp. H3(2019)]|uniref:acetyltransferase n=1 Tax=Pseudomonas sp. H3(2019) TaxID=2598724 RepID=UPI001192C5BA|nr:acetyltransferase [Pseudomonas sp. H3(2019)]TVT82779.1 acetyltransferase [Pseudomonas sp. H3(2019)]